MIKKLLVVGSIGVLSLVGCGDNSELTGQGFLMTKGGMARTCAGNKVYLEKSNSQGYVAVHDKIAVLKDKLNENENTLNFYYDEVISLRKSINQYGSDTKFGEVISLRKSINKYGSDTTFGEVLKKSEKLVDMLEENNAVIEDELEALEFDIEHLSRAEVKETTCDSQGNFSFNELEEGKYYISTKVEWFVGKEKQGGIVSKTITIKDGKNKIILTEK